MKKNIIRFAAYSTAFVITLSGSAINSQAATSSLMDVLPSAGITYTLGSNSTSLSQVQLSSTQSASDKSKTEATASSEDKKSAKTASSNVNNTEAAGNTAESKEGKKDKAVLGENRNESEKVSDVLESASIVPTSNITEETDKSEEKASITDAADVTEKSTEETEVKTSSNKVIQDTIIISRGYTDDLKAASGATVDEEDESFENLVIAQVSNYVNVRDLPSEEGEIVGKLYNNSVGNYIEEENGWYKISSGSVEGYVKGEFCVTGEAAVDLAKQVGTRIATVTTTTLYVREEASTESSVIGMVPIEDELIVMEELDGWVKVNVEEGDGYVSTDYVTLSTEFVKAESKAEEEARLAKEEAERKAAQAAAASRKSSGTSSSSSDAYADTGNYAPAGSASGQNVVNFALQFVGNPYVYGGSSLTHGTDCSGFVMSVYKNFGVSLPHSSAADRSVGSTVGSLEEAQPGDIVCYSGHVGIYAGNGQIVHASTSKTGIIVSSASYRKILSIRRIF